jgi:hypothetical protein
MDTEIMAREKCGLLAVSHTVPVSRVFWSQTTQHNGENTSEKEIELKNFTGYVSSYTENDKTGMLSPPDVWSFSVAADINSGVFDF